MKRVKIIDYDAGNLFNVLKAFEYLGCKVDLVSNQDEIGDGDFLVLPGVGAFGDGMANLQDRLLLEPIIEWVSSGKPFLGICLGMQLLFSSSEEFGHFKGLNIIPGKVKRLPVEPGFKIPNIGWSPLKSTLKDHVLDWKDTYLECITEEQDMYFVHSYAAYPDNQEHWLAQTAFGNHWFCSVVRKNNVFGCQFHPEKSGEIGLNILKNFISN
jgi:imidazole glycerol-phosphate synthase subunit HisH